MKLLSICFLFLVCISCILAKPAHLSLSSNSDLCIAELDKLAEQYEEKINISHNPVLFNLSISFLNEDPNYLLSFLGSSASQPGPILNTVLSSNQTTHFFFSTPELSDKDISIVKSSSSGPINNNGSSSTGVSTMVGGELFFGYIEPDSIMDKGYLITFTVEWSIVSSTNSNSVSSTQVAITGASLNAPSFLLQSGGNPTTGEWFLVGKSLNSMGNQYKNKHYIISNAKGEEQVVKRFSS